MTNGSKISIIRGVATIITRWMLSSGHSISRYMTGVTIRVDTTTALHRITAEKKRTSKAYDSWNTFAITIGTSYLSREPTTTKAITRNSAKAIYLRTTVAYWQAIVQTRTFSNPSMTFWKLPTPRPLYMILWISALTVFSSRVVTIWSINAAKRILRKVVWPMVTSFWKMEKCMSDKTKAT